MGRIAGDTGVSKASLRRALEWHFRYTLGGEGSPKSPGDLYRSLGLAVRDLITDRMRDAGADPDAKRVYYLSMEFLLGRSLGNTLYNLQIYNACRELLEEFGSDLEEVREQERDAPFGNGGLGRLAACFLDSMATLGIAGCAYGIYYDYGLFTQEIEDGYQREKPEPTWSGQSPWEIAKPQEACLVPFGGRIEHAVDRRGHYNPMWMDWKVVVGVPHDIPIVGYGGRTVNSLRLYKACASSEFDMKIFNEGDYFKAVEQKIAVETISRVLYPADTFQAGRELRLLQEIFLVCCALRDIVRRYLKNHSDFSLFPSKVAIQMNDTHPSLAVAELMRLLVDEYEVPWEAAWEITVGTLAYTNHTLLPEALEKWPVGMLEQMAPRHMQIIYEINRRFLDAVKCRWPDDPDRLQRTSLVEEGAVKRIRMAHLAIVGSHSVNGVSALHTELVKHRLVPDFFELWPERFTNKTNGVTQRRWLLKANPELAALITGVIGDGWITRLEALRLLEGNVEDSGFRRAFREVKRRNKERLAAVIFSKTGIRVDPEALFDIQAKRIHEYKRQLLKVMHIVHEYLSILEDGIDPPVPRVFVFAGKAAPGYWHAKQIIKLIHDVGAVVNRDTRAGKWLTVVFVPDYRVSMAEKIIPAADLSEQISMAGTEASGTGNMKFSLNGALTVGTLDGANIEIRQEVGADNLFTFGMTAERIEALIQTGGYRPREYCRDHPEIRRIMDALTEDRFCPAEPERFRWIRGRILEEGDPYFHLADLSSYIEVQRRAADLYVDPEAWARKALINVARMGKFSSDRAVAEYARDIWGIAVD
ncbi:MAG: glycogen/starch/alpha-glucan phosphorylase [Deltaproteobacteria bacterium]|nr:glycogen/starch/alpha-glucan phosphorylase [Deltaproteobacteria bacterium]